jgi:hypothetical protein
LLAAFLEAFDGCSRTKEGEHKLMLHGIGIKAQSCLAVKAYGIPLRYAIATALTV